MLRRQGNRHSRKETVSISLCIIVIVALHFCSFSLCVSASPSTHQFLTREVNSQKTVTTEFFSTPLVQTSSLAESLGATQSAFAATALELESKSSRSLELLSVKGSGATVQALSNRRRYKSKSCGFFLFNNEIAASRNLSKDPAAAANLVASF
jgi:hypothetical protein